MNEVYVKSFISQRCIGYSADFNRTHFENVVEYSDGTVKTMYSTHKKDTSGFTTIGELYSFPPIVDRPV